MYAPPDGVAYGPDYFINTTMVLFKTGSGIAIVMLQTLILMGVCVWPVVRFALRPGALTILFVLGNTMIAATLTNDTPIFLTYLAMSIAAGLCADLIVARVRPSRERPVALGLFGALVPGVYYGTYFLFTALTGGVWWSWTLTLGAIVWSMLCGLALTLLAAA